MDRCVPNAGPPFLRQRRLPLGDSADADARLIESTVWVNEAHPAYRRAVSSRAEAYHLALAVAAALAPLAVEPQHAQRFISAFLARWGEQGGAPARQDRSG